MEQEILENHRRYSKRINIYKNLGYNIEKEGNNIVEKSEPLYGDILEVGTGKGHFAVALAKKGYNFTTIDISEQEQKIAKLNIKYLGLEKRVDFKIENAENLSFKNGSFDIIFSINIIHHLVNPFKVLDELIRVISFEGKIILSDFTKAGMEIIDKMHSSEGRIHQAHKTSLLDVGNYLINKGFKLEKDRTNLQEIVIAFHQLM